MVVAVHGEQLVVGLGRQERVVGRPELDRTAGPLSRQSERTGSVEPYRMPMRLWSTVVIPAHRPVGSV